MNDLVRFNFLLGYDRKLRGLSHYYLTLLSFELSDNFLNKIENIEMRSLTLFYIYIFISYRVLREKFG